MYQTHLERGIGDTEQNASQPKTVSYFLDRLGSFRFQGDEPDSVCLGKRTRHASRSERGRYLPIRRFHSLSIRSMRAAGQ
jgi:hypothetical protein